MPTKLWALLTAAGVAIAAPAFAHHSVAVDYDANKPGKVTGVVTKVEWTNPHAHYYIDVTDEQGNVTNWNFELATINALQRQGWTSKALKVGDRVLVSAPRRTMLRTVVLSHMTHHRAQLSVYYRLLGAMVPGMYGPSADEGLP